MFDPGQRIDGAMDVAIRDGVIAEIAPGLDPGSADRVVDVGGALVTPGLIDMHTHVAAALRKVGEDDLYLAPDIAGVYGGVTTVVDAGSVGAYNLGGFARFVAPAARTRVISFINAGVLGIFQAPEVTRRENIDVEAAIDAIRASDGLVRGVKVRMVGPALDLLGIELPRLAKEIAVEGEVPLMVHVGDIVTGNPVARELTPVLLADVLTAGDIVTHTTSHQVGALLDADGKLLKEAHEARARGVLFDTGVGMANFSLASARAVLDQGLIPDTISSDLTASGRRGTLSSLTECMNKFMALGLSVGDVVLRTTAYAAGALGMSEELGAIEVGREADLSVLDLVDGDWMYRDNSGEVLQARHEALAPRLTVRTGRVFPVDFGPRPWGWLPERAG